VASRRSTAVGLLGAWLLLALAVVALQAQEAVWLAGWVQSAARTRMQVMTESAVSVAVDLKQADQASYQALRNGERVVVDGVVSSDRRRIVAREIGHDSGRGSSIQSP
jgi:hypothetical protein